jgi:hypothetical protein
LADRAAGHQMTQASFQRAQRQVMRGLDRQEPQSGPDQRIEIKHDGTG